jgi:hypothetical protein
MSPVKSLVIGFVFVLAATAAAIGQPSASLNKLFKGVPTVRKAATSPSKVDAEYINSYYLGYDLASARDQIKKNEVRESLAQLAFLWDELYLQPEASQVEAVMRAVVRGQGTADMKIAKLDAAAASIETRLKADHKWYYSMGKAYSELEIASTDKDYDALDAKFIELGKLSKTAPMGTPADLVNALVKIGEISAKSTVTDADVAVLKEQFNVIDKMMGA